MHTQLLELCIRSKSRRSELRALQTGVHVQLTWVDCLFHGRARRSKERGAMAKEAQLTALRHAAEGVSGLFDLLSMKQEEVMLGSAQINLVSSAVLLCVILSTNQFSINLVSSA